MYLTEVTSRPGRERAVQLMHGFNHGYLTINLIGLISVT